MIIIIIHVPLFPEGDHNAAKRQKNGVGNATQHKRVTVGFPMK